MKAVLFDLDGTLVDAREWHFHALNDALKIFGFEIQHSEHLNEFDGLSTKTKLKILSEKRNLPTNLHEIIFQIKQERTLRIISKECYPIVPVTVTLKRLRNLGIKLGVVTNSILATTNKMLDGSGLLDFFEVIITNEDVQFPKPNPEGYMKAMQKLSVFKDEVVVVEDGEYGIAAAKRAGIKNIIKINNPFDLNLELFNEYFGQLLD